MAKKKRRRKIIRKEYNNWLLAVIIMLILVILFMLNNLNTGTPAPSGGDDDNTNDVPDIPEDENCDWYIIDEIRDFDMPSASDREYRGNVPAGRFRFKWGFDGNMDVTVGIVGGEGQSFLNSIADVYYFNTTSTRTASFILRNNYRSSLHVNYIQLEQWLCDSDDRNWSPDMFDEPYYDSSYNEADAGCNDWCTSNQYPEGYAWTGGDCIDGYVRDGDLYNLCCCYIGNN